ncbi:unnamed protein product [Phytomonas sp. Hart1]|nr:unnamed protein product [Phytomonas sp. Hart1]|eukprot:CCW71092.1 unnamed protein product [Phytomonas sp. isolate Hart1]
MPKAAKRGRKPLSKQPQPEAAAPFSSFPPLVESIETVEAVEHILLRFPCFDYFRNVHVCERPSEGGPASPEAIFHPGGVQFDEESPPERGVAHPLVFLNPGSPSRMVFRGSWEETLPEGEGGRTNRVILHLTPRGRRDGDEAGESKDGETNEMEKKPTPSVVSSLFRHRREGVTADEKRQREEQRAKGAGDWVYDKVITPSAVLVMSRIG